MKAESKYRGAVVLSAVGDALGWITEFEKSKDTLIEKYGVDQIQEFLDWGKNVGGRFWGYRDNIKAGSYSDDTQLMLSIARTVGREGNVDLHRFSKVELPVWLQYARGGGRTVKQAAEKIQRKTVRWNTNYFTYRIKEEKVDYRDSGANGAAMRVLPIALACVGNDRNTFQNAFNTSIITHGHPRAIIGALLYCYAAQQYLIRDPANFEPLSLITQLGKDIHKRFSLSNLVNHEISAWMKLWDKGVTESFSKLYEKTLGETQSQLRIVYQSIRDEVEDITVLNQLGCLDQATKGSGVSTVNAGIYFATKYFDEPTKAVIAAVNAFGTDTDSIASFTGGMLGALHGLATVPDQWRNIQDYEYLVSIADRLLKISEDSFQDDSFSMFEEGIKSIDKIEKDDFVIDEYIYSAALGQGQIKNIIRQNTLSQGKYNLILDVTFSSGQTCIFNQLFDLPDFVE